MALGWAMFISWQATLMIVLGMPLLLVPVSLLLRRGNFFNIYMCPVFGTSSVFARANNSKACPDRGEVSMN